MQKDNLIEVFSEQRDCIYKGEKYSVRDNGAVLRHQPESKPKSRPLDNKWTFGKKNSKTGYMTIGSHRVHIIVATAFHGEHNSKVMVVDHKDTNRCNNRAANLRWLTRVENVLNNPITRAKIAYLCGGDINKVLDNPACLRELAGSNKDVKWMRTVSVEEAKNAELRIKDWQVLPGVKKEKHDKKSLYETLYAPIRQSAEYEGINKGYHVSKSKCHDNSNDLQIKDYESPTPNARQRNWKTPTMFPSCPQEPEKQNLLCYAANLKIGDVITCNQYGAHYIDEFILYGNKLFIRAHTSVESLKPFSLITVSLEEDWFVHEGTTFFEERGAIKAFLTNTGREFDGAPGIDDCC